MWKKTRRFECQGQDLACLQDEAFRRKERKTCCRAALAMSFYAESRCGLQMFFAGGEF